MSKPKIPSGPARRVNAYQVKAGLLSLLAPASRLFLLAALFASMGAASAQAILPEAPPQPPSAPDWDPGIHPLPATATAFAFDAEGSNVAPDGGTMAAYTTTGEGDHVWATFHATITNPLPSTGHINFRLDWSRYGHPDAYPCYIGLAFGNQYGDSFDATWSYNTSGRSDVGYERRDFPFPTGERWGVGTQIHVDIISVRSSGAIECPAIVEMSALLAALNLVVVANEPEPTAAGVRQLRAWPNPTTGPLHVALDLDRPEQVRVSIFDVMGREIDVLYDAETPTLQIDFNTSRLAPGMYVIRVVGETFTKTQRFTKQE